ncbi:Phytochrome-like protein cph2 [Methylobacterium bullatum]|uniref:diguanylate cyclase n=1 Tax=Methylobacterium bullatum TaxID=570505 RepID=A0A679J879_9HYPH|nr:Phytochrome-like protein cph2 [Methylobacterium bullatum]
MGLKLRLGPVTWSARTWIVLGVLAPIGMLITSGVMLLDLRRDAWDKAEQTSRNLLRVIERDIARNFEIIDLSIQGVVDGLNVPGVRDVSSELRQLILFDRAASARDMGVMLVLDENGDTVIDAASVTPRKLNNSDRDYFKAHKARADLGLYISPPVVSRLLGTPVLVLSRRINNPDGSFGGIVLGSLSLSYFHRLFDRIGLGPYGAINLYRSDGMRIVRHPYLETDIGSSIAGTPTFERFRREGSGSFVGTSPRDGSERHFAFTRIGDLPFILNVTLSAYEIEAEWRGKALVISLIVVLLCGLTIGLSLLFWRELRRRAAIQAELERLSRTDMLTGLPNRRAFEEMVARLWTSARRQGTPLSLLVVDADHFKRYNDRHGHAVGDRVLQGIGRCLSASLRRDGDIVCRVGGEEFVLLLPDADGAAALGAAERVHARMSTLSVPSAGIEAGAITVSVGAASALPAAGGSTDPFDLYRRADAALFEAKAAGRNRTCCAAPEGAAHPPAAPDGVAD